MSTTPINDAFVLLFHRWCSGGVDLWPNGWFKNFGWDHGATLLAALIGAAVTVTGVLLGIWGTARAHRRERRATLYAEALRAVADYLEGPYRVRRKDGTSERRAAISEHLNEVKSRVDYHQGLLQLHAASEVATAYDAYVMAACSEAGQQMKEAWLLPPVKKDRKMNLGNAYPRSASDAARQAVLAAMREDLGVR